MQTPALAMYRAFYNIISLDKEVHDGFLTRTSS